MSTCNLNNKAGWGCKYMILENQILEGHIVFFTALHLFDLLIYLSCSYFAGNFSYKLYIKLLKYDALLS